MSGLFATIGKGICLPWVPLSQAGGCWLWWKAPCDDGGTILYWENYFYQVNLPVLCSSSLHFKITGTSLSKNTQAWGLDLNLPLTHFILLTMVRYLNSIVLYMIIILIFNRWAWKDTWQCFGNGHQETIYTIETIWWIIFDKVSNFCIFGLRKKN